MRFSTTYANAISALFMFMRKSHLTKLYQKFTVIYHKFKHTIP